MSWAVNQYSRQLGIYIYIYILPLYIPINSKTTAYSYSDDKTYLMQDL